MKEKRKRNKQRKKERKEGKSDGGTFIGMLDQEVARMG